MKASAVEAIANLARQNELCDLTEAITPQEGCTLVFRTKPTEHGRELGDIVTPPQPATLSLSTLTGFADAVALAAWKPEDTIVHVQDHLTVALRARSSDVYGRRDTFLVAKHDPIKAFVFDQFYDDPSRFLIALETSFLETEQTLYLKRLVSNLKAGNSVHTEDDGFSQTVTLKAGEVSTAEIKVKPRIKLIMLRTFPEASPVESEFLIRFKQSAGGAPSVALFDVDGGKWKGDTMRSIKSWLEKQDALKGYSILA